MNLDFKCVYTCPSTTSKHSVLDKLFVIYVVNFNVDFRLWLCCYSVHFIIYIPTKSYLFSSKILLKCLICCKNTQMNTNSGLEPWVGKSECLFSNYWPLFFAEPVFWHKDELIYLPISTASSWIFPDIILQ